MDTQATTLVSTNYSAIASKASHSYSGSVRTDNPTAVVVNSALPPQKALATNEDSSRQKQKEAKLADSDIITNGLFSNYRRETSFDDQVYQHIMLTIRSNSDQVIWQVPSLDNLQMRAYMMNANHYQHTKSMLA